MIPFNKNSLYTLGLSISPLIINNFRITEIPSFDLILPSKTKKRGRPKGCQYNNLGIPCKKSKKNYQTIPFKQLNIKEKQQKILSWIFDKEKAKIIIRNNEEVLLNDIPDDPSCLAYNLLDEDEDINVIRRHFSETSWKKFKEVNCFLG